MQLTDTTAAALTKLCDAASMKQPGSSWVSVFEAIEADANCKAVIDAGLFRVISASQGELTERGAEALREYEARKAAARVLTVAEAERLAEIADANGIDGGARGLLRAALNGWMTGLGDELGDGPCNAG